MHHIILIITIMYNPDSFCLMPQWLNDILADVSDVFYESYNFNIQHVEFSTCLVKLTVHCYITRNLSYTVNPASLSWWQKLSTMQLPWEWVDNSEPQQVLNNVAFSIKSGQMLAIMGNSGNSNTLCTCRQLFSVLQK